MGCAICDGAKQWLKQPFNSQGSVVNWFLFLGLVLIAVFFWSRLLVRIAP